MSLEVPDGQVLALLGPNGAGKSTTLKTIVGLVVPRAGSFRFADTEIGGMAPHRINRLGIAHVPEERRIFGDLTVDEYLAIAARTAGRVADAARRVSQRRRTADARYRAGARDRTAALTARRTLSGTGSGHRRCCRGGDRNAARAGTCNAAR